MAPLHATRSYAGLDDLFFFSLRSSASLSYLCFEPRTCLSSVTLSSEPCWAAAVLLASFYLGKTVLYCQGGAVEASVSVERAESGGASQWVRLHLQGRVVRRNNVVFQTFAGGGQSASKVA